MTTREQEYTEPFIIRYSPFQKQQLTCLRSLTTACSPFLGLPYPHGDSVLEERITHPVEFYQKVAAMEVVGFTITEVVLFVPNESS